MALHLDARQRAMLAQMHVRVWSPLPAAQELAQAQSPQAQSSNARRIEASPTDPRSADVPPLIQAKTVERQVAPALSQRQQGVDHMDWAALQHTVTQCQSCTLCNTRHNTVFGVGAPAPLDQAPQADWLIVGEAPGENEDLQGEPFVGQAGKLLDNMLRAMGLARKANDASAGVYITNVLKCRPPGNRNPKPEEVAQCLPYLERQVALLQPKIIVTMGRFAVQALLHDTYPDVETTPLGKLRGKVHHYQGVPVVVTYHPAYVLRNLPEKAKVWADLCLAMATRKATDASQT